MDYAIFKKIKGADRPLVYRVNWLRAKARKERWEEEMELVAREMDWTVNCFEHYEAIWKGRAEAAESAGKGAYAWKQGSMWERWAKMARDRFGDIKE